MLTVRQELNLEVFGLKELNQARNLRPVESEEKTRSAGQLWIKQYKEQEQELVLDTSAIDQSRVNGTL